MTSFPKGRSPSRRPNRRTGNVRGGQGRAVFPVADALQIVRPGASVAFDRDGSTARGVSDVDSGHLPAPLRRCKFCCELHQEEWPKGLVRNAVGVRRPVHPQPLLDVFGCRHGSHACHGFQIRHPLLQSPCQSETGPEMWRYGPVLIEDLPVRSNFVQSCCRHLALSPKLRLWHMDCVFPFEKGMS